MTLKILLPERVVLEETVDKVVAESPRGSFGLLPRHVDYVAPLVPGILSFTQDEEESFVAVDEGVLVAVPVYGITRQGVKGYFQQYVRPNPLMLPFHVIGELSRTLALAVRLFGNITSGSLIVAILLSIAPLFFPVIMQAFGLLIGVIQAYVFAILALVYIASAERVHRQRDLGNSSRA